MALARVCPSCHQGNPPDHRFCGGDAPASDRALREALVLYRTIGAIMFTDMVGYSALAQRNEALALDLLGEQQARLRPFFVQHGGREIKTTGDGFLVEFGSALQAVRCAIAIQRGLVELNASTAVERRFQVRIGLHLGDVEVRDGDVFGEGVNIAARVQPLADAGGICITGPVADQVHNKIDMPLERLRQAPLKNIEAAIDVYRVVLPWTLGAAARRGGPAPRRLGGRAGAIVGLVVVALLGWWLTTRSAHTPGAPPAEKSVAVLPFVNMSSDKENEYLQSTYEHIRDRFECEYRGKLPVKNAGDIDMYFVTRPKPAEG